VAKEDVIGGIQHDLHLEVDVNIINGKPDIAEAAMCFGNHRVGGFHHHYLTTRIQDVFYHEFALDEQEDGIEGDGVMAYLEVIGAIGVVYCASSVYCQTVISVRATLRL
jgi:hypothetical protein